MRLLVAFQLLLGVLQSAVTLVAAKSFEKIEFGEYSFELIGVVALCYDLIIDDSCWIVNNFFH